MRSKRKSFDWMEGETYSNISLFFIGIFIIIAGFALQRALIFSPDVNYLIYASQQLWEGGHYGREIFETNPPMILYLYLPVIFLKKILFSNIHAALHWYVLILGLFSAGASYLLLKKLVPEDRFYRNAMILTYLFVIFFLPAHAFGQREHIFFMLIFPYLLSVAFVLQDKSLSPYFQFFISLFAGLGFAIKPFFIIPLVFIECYVIFYKKNILPAFRLNNIVIFSVFVLYLLSIAIWQKGYFTIILPLVMKYYFPIFAMDWVKFFLQQNVLFCLAMIISYFVFFRKDQYQSLGMVFCLALIGTLIAYVIPKQWWYYHLYPALALGFIVIVHCIKQLSIFPMAKSQWSHSRQILIFMIMLEIAAFLPLNTLIKTILVLTNDKKISSIPLQAFINSSSGERSAFCFGVVTSDCFPMITVSNVRYAESFASLWWFVGLREVEKKDPRNQTLIKDRKFLIDAVSEDLNQYQARWLIVNQDIIKLFEGDHFEILDYFSQNENFKEAIKNYQYKQNVSTYAIYERKAS